MKLEIFLMKPDATARQKISAIYEDHPNPSQIAVFQHHDKHLPQAPLLPHTTYFGDCQDIDHYIQIILNDDKLVNFIKELYTQHPFKRIIINIDYSHPFFSALVRNQSRHYLMTDKDAKWVMDNPAEGPKKHPIKWVSLILDVDEKATHSEKMVCHLHTIFPEFNHVFRSEKEPFLFSDNIPKEDIFCEMECNDLILVWFAQGIYTALKDEVKWRSSFSRLYGKDDYKPFLSLMTGMGPAASLYHFDPKTSIADGSPSFNKVVNLLKRELKESPLHYEGSIIFESPKKLKKEIDELDRFIHELIKQINEMDIPKNDNIGPFFDLQIDDRNVDVDSLEEIMRNAKNDLIQFKKKFAYPLKEDEMGVFSEFNEKIKTASSIDKIIKKINSVQDELSRIKSDIIKCSLEEIKKDINLSEQFDAFLEKINLNEDEIKQKQEAAINQMLIKEMNDISDTVTHAEHVLMVEEDIVGNGPQSKKIQNLYKKINQNIDAIAYARRHDFEIDSSLSTENLLREIKQKFELKFGHLNLSYDGKALFNFNFSMAKFKKSFVDYQKAFSRMELRYQESKAESEKLFNSLEKSFQSQGVAEATLPAKISKLEENLIELSHSLDNNPANYWFDRVHIFTMFNRAKIDSIEYCKNVIFPNCRSEFRSIKAMERFYEVKSKYLNDLIKKLGERREKENRLKEVFELQEKIKHEVNSFLGLADLHLLKVDGPLNSFSQAMEILLKLQEIISRWDQTKSIFDQVNAHVLTFRNKSIIDIRFMFREILSYIADNVPENELPPLEEIRDCLHEYTGSHDLEHILINGNYFETLKEFEDILFENYTMKKDKEQMSEGGMIVFYKMLSQKMGLLVFNENMKKEVKEYLKKRFFTLAEKVLLCRELKYGFLEDSSAIIENCTVMLKTEYKDSRKEDVAVKKRAILNIILDRVVNGLINIYEFELQVRKSIEKGDMKEIYEEHIPYYIGNMRDMNIIIPEVRKMIDVLIQETKKLVKKYDSDEKTGALKKPFSEPIVFGLNYEERMPSSVIQEVDRLTISLRKS